MQHGELLSFSQSSTQIHFFHMTWKLSSDYMLQHTCTHCGPRSNEPVVRGTRVWREHNLHEALLWRHALSDWIWPRQLGKLLWCLTAYVCALVYSHSVHSALSDKLGEGEGDLGCVLGSYQPFAVCIVFVVCSTRSVRECASCSCMDHTCWSTACACQYDLPQSSMLRLVSHVSMLLCCSAICPGNRRLQACVMACMRVKFYVTRCNGINLLQTLGNESTFVYTDWGICLQNWSVASHVHGTRSWARQDMLYTHMDLFT